MRHDTASRTALRVAIRRAEHQVLDSPRILEDPLAAAIIGPEAAAKIMPGVISRTQRLSLSFRAYMAVRSRYAEDALARAAAAGVRQYVVLGAGLDTFADRNPFPELRVFEIDHPATQAWKRERLAAGGIAVPAGVTFVPADFERHSLEEELRVPGYSPEEPVFFSWLGVTPYLTDEAFAQTMGYVAGRAAGSGITFDYSVTRDGLNPVQLRALEALTTRVAHYGEPLRLFFEREALGVRLREMGFGLVEDLGREEMNARYCAGRGDGLRVKGNLARLVTAWI